MEWFKELSKLVPEQYHKTILIIGLVLIALGAAAAIVKIILECIKLWYEIKEKRRQEERELRRKEHEEAERRLKEKRPKVHEAREMRVVGMLMPRLAIGDVPLVVPLERFATWALRFFPERFNLFVISAIILGLVLSLMSRFALL